jgi:hypothetical protein
LIKFRVGDIVILLPGGDAMEHFLHRPGKVTETNDCSIGIRFLDDNTWAKHWLTTGPMQLAEAYRTEVGSELMKTISLD